MKHSIQFDHVRLKPSEQIGSHQQPTWELSLVIEGEGIRTIAGVSEPFKSGEVALVPPEIPHCWQFTDNAEKIENITVIFAPELFTQWQQQSQNCKHYLEILRNPRRELSSQDGRGRDCLKV